MFLWARLGNRSGQKSIFLDHTYFENMTSIIWSYNCKLGSNTNQVCAFYCPMKMPKSPFWRLAKIPLNLNFQQRLLVEDVLLNSLIIPPVFQKVKIRLLPKLLLTSRRTKNRVPLFCIFNYFPVGDRTEKKKEEKVRLIACKMMSRLKLWHEKKPH